MKSKTKPPVKSSPKPSGSSKRRSGADRRQEFITPYMKFVYNGDEKRSDDERRKHEERRKKSRDKE